MTYSYICLYIEINYQCLEKCNKNVLTSHNKNVLTSHNPLSSRITDVANSKFDLKINEALRINLKNLT